MPLPHEQQLVGSPLRYIYAGYWSANFVPKEIGIFSRAWWATGTST